MFKLGIIGCGKIVERGHAGALKELADKVEVIALSDPSEGRTKTIAELLGLENVTHYSDYKEMLANEKDLNLIDLALPHSLHEPITIDCANAGLNIITEKPLTTDLESAERMIKAVRDNGVKLGILHNYHYNPVMTKAEEIVAAGTIGKVFLIRWEGMGGGFYPGTDTYDPAWRTKSSKGGGGCLIDNGYHNIYLACTFMGSPVTSVYARAGTYVQPFEVEDTALMLMSHENGGVSSIQVGWGIKAGGTRVSEVHGDKGSIFFGRDDKAISVFINEAGEYSYPEYGEKGNGFKAIFEETFDAMAKNTRIPHGIEEARMNIAIIDAGYESARTGEAVAIK